jgi:DNA-binding NarL/FixJ family response regulator
VEGAVLNLRIHLRSETAAAFGSLYPADFTLYRWPENCTIEGMIEPATGPIRIAIADDHPVFRDGIGAILQTEEDFRLVGKASNGRDILRIAEEQRPEILLLDLSMPVMDGLTTLRHLREIRSGTKVIVLTASEDREQLMEAMQLGAAGIVLKKDLTTALIKSIRRVHAGEIWMQSSTTQAVMAHVAPAAAPAPEHPPFRSALLTRKESEVVRLVAQGLRNREIASRMVISEQTVKNHLRTIFEKLQVGDRLELALYAIHNLGAV